jgi:zinc transporter ZupT
LETFKGDTEEVKEENFKNLFTNSGKIVSMLVEKDQRKKMSQISGQSFDLQSGIFNRSSPGCNNTPATKRSPINYKVAKSNLKENLLEDKTLAEEEQIQPQKDSITSYLLLLALSIHACFEGIAIGLQESPGEIFYMLLAITFHKWVEALSIGINLYKSNIERKLLLTFIILFASMTPLGMLLGILFSGLSETTEAIFLSISAGMTIFT